MTAEELLRQLEQGATLEGPHWTEAVKVLTAKARGTKIEVQAVGLHGKRLWTKLLQTGERLFAIHLTAGRFRKSQPYALLDLKAPEAEPNVAAELRQSATDEEQTIEWSLEEVTPAYFGEITDRRTRALAIKEKYVRKSLQFLISESAKKITKYDTQLRQIRDELHRGQGPGR